MTRYRIAPREAAPWELALITVVVVWAVLVLGVVSWQLRACHAKGGVPVKGWLGITCVAPVAP